MAGENGLIKTLYFVLLLLQHVDWVCRGCSKIKLINYFVGTYYESFNSVYMSTIITLVDGDAM